MNSPRNTFFLILAVLFSVSFAKADWTASGTFQYTDRLYTQSGFTGTAPRAVREADVEVFDVNTMAVLASGATDQTGAFSIVVPDAATRTVGVRVLASTTETPTLDFSVYDDFIGGDPIYSYTDSGANGLNHGPTTNVDFGTMTMPASIGTVATTDWSSQVFNVLDLSIRIADWIASVDGARPAVGMSTGWNPTQGRGGSSYSGSSNNMNLSDDDGYDDPNILHELGHYVEDEFGRSRNTGGSHSISDDDQDPRLAWSEGFATYVSAATLKFHSLPLPNIYIDRDSFGTSGGGGFGYNFESTQNGGGTNEGAVQAALWDLIDDSATADTTPGVDDDGASGFENEIWEVLEEMRNQQLPFTSMEDFWDLWRELGLGSESTVQAAFASHRIYYQVDSFEPNNTPETATPLTSSYKQNHFYKSGSEAAGDEDWFSFSAVSGNYYRLSVNGSANTIYGRPDPEMFLINSDKETVLAFSDDPHDTSLNAATSNNNMIETVPEIIWQAPASGTYYVYCRHSSHELNKDGRYGTYNIRVTGTSAPTPTISEVGAQQMRPGQSYWAAVTGSNFSQGAAVTVSNPNITVGEVVVVSSSSLVVELSAAPAAGNGTSNLTVTNPGGSGGTHANAVEISTSAQPPILITEIDLGADKVEVKNIGTVTATLTGWELESRMPSTQTYTFPAFTLAAGATVIVSEGTGTDTATNLYDQSSAFNWGWNANVRGDINLIDSGERSVDYVRFVSKYSDVFQAPQGTNAVWIQPERGSPLTVNLTISRDETSAVPRTTIGMGNTFRTMPSGASSRDNAIDAFEPNESIRSAPMIESNDTPSDLEISERPSNYEDEDWFGVALEAGSQRLVTISFTDASGNLELEAYAPGEETTPMLSATSTTNHESLTLTTALTNANGSGVYKIRVFGNSNDTNSYSLSISDANQPDTPDLSPASDSGISNTDNLTTDTTPTCTGTASPSSAITLFSNITGQIGSTTASPTTGAWTITSSALPEGIHQISSKENGGPSSASLTVVIDLTAPTVTLTQAPGQSDPASSGPVEFRATFNESVNGFDSGDVTTGGTLGGSATVTGGPTIFTVSITATGTEGNIKGSIPGGVATDDAGNSNSASNNVDNSVSIDTHGSNGGTATALSFSGGGSAANSGWIEPLDTDMFSIVITETKLIEIGTTGAVDTRGSLTTSVGSPVHDANADRNAGSGNNFLISTILSPGTYFLAVTSEGTANTGDYSLFANLNNVPIVINEIDATTQASDGREFVELYDGGIGNVSLTGMALVFFDGATDQVYLAVDLDGEETDGLGYFVLGSTGVSNVDLTLPDDSFQNGADAAALFVGDDTDFPVGTPVTTAGLLEAVVYDSGQADDSGLLALLNASEPQLDETGTANIAGHSLQRLPNGDGGQRVTSTFSLISPTPGQPNSIPSAPPAPDLTAASDSGISQTDNITRFNMLTLEGNNRPGSIVALSSNVAGLVGTSITAVDGTWSVTSNSLSEGTHTLTATADGSPTGSPLNVEIDNTSPPEVPPFDLIGASDTGVSSTDNITADQTPTFEGTAPAGTTVTLFVNSVEFGTAPGGGTWSLTPSAPIPDGGQSITATATDPAGNATQSSFTIVAVIDTIGPTATIDVASGQFDPAPSGPVDFEIQFNEDVTGLDSSDFTVGGNIWGSVVVSGGPRTYTTSVSTTGDEGFVTISLPANAVSDLAGNISTTGSVTDNRIVLDEHGADGNSGTPVTFISSLSSASGWLEAGDVDAFTFTLSGPRVAIIQSTGSIDTVGELRDATGTVVNDISADDNDGTGSNFRISEPLPAGTYTVLVSEKGDIGNYQVDFDVLAVPLVQPDILINGLGDGIYETTTGQSVFLKSKKARTVRASALLQNDGEIPDSILLTGRNGTGLFRLSYISASEGNVTAAVATGTHETALSGAGSTIDLVTCVIKPNKRKIKKVIRRGGKKKVKYKKKSISILMRASSLALPEKSDTGSIRAKTSK